MSKSGEGLERLTRWQLGHTQPEPYSLDLDHPVQDDIAWAADALTAVERERDEAREEREKAEQHLESLQNKYERATDALDLMHDEFLRIKALSPGGEIEGIADRGVSEIERRVPVITELEETKARLRDTEFLYHAFAVLCWDAGIKPGSAELIEAAERFSATVGAVAD